MEEEIRRIVKREFPTLASAYHLPHVARVEAISDPVATEQVDDRFRPRYAVDVAVLLPNGEVDPDLPLFRAVPLPVACAGMERGQFGFPEPGALVEVAFAYGLPDQIFIRQVLPWHNSLPAVAVGEQVNQNAPGVVERTAANGDKQRSTHGNITDACLNYLLQAVTQNLQVQEHYLEAKENSTEEIGGVKLIEALGALKLLSGGSLNLASVDNLNQTTASDLNTTVSRDVKERCGNIVDRLAKLKQLIKVKDGGTVWLGSESVNLVRVLEDLCQVVADFASTTATHTHPNVQPCSQEGAINGYSSAAAGLKGEAAGVRE